MVYDNTLLVTMSLVWPGYMRLELEAPSVVVGNLRACCWLVNFMVHVDTTNTLWIEFTEAMSWGVVNNISWWTCATLYVCNGFTIDMYKFYIVVYIPLSCVLFVAKTKTVSDYCMADKLSKMAGDVCTSSCVHIWYSILLPNALWYVIPFL